MPPVGLRCSSFTARRRTALRDQPRECHLRRGDPGPPTTDVAWRTAPTPRGITVCLMLFSG